MVQSLLFSYRLACGFVRRNCSRRLGGIRSVVRHSAIDCRFGSGKEVSKKVIMTKEELKKSVNENLDYVKSSYENNQGFSTTLVIETLKEKKKHSIAIILHNDAAMENRFKVIFGLGIRTAIQKFRGDVESIEAIYLMSEAWTSIPSKPIKKGQEDKMGRPSEDPNRKEAIISTGLSRDGLNAFGIFEIKKSLDIISEKFKVDLVPLEIGNKKKDIEMESPLLKRFWSGVELTESLFDKMPEDLRVVAKDMPVDPFLNMIMQQLEEANKKYKTNI
jgi:hypothetical protein